MSFLVPVLTSIGKLFQAVGVFIVNSAPFVPNLAYPTFGAAATTGGTAAAGGTAAGAGAAGGGTATGVVTVTTGSTGLTAAEVASGVGSTVATESTIAQGIAHAVESGVISGLQGSQALAEAAAAGLNVSTESFLTFLQGQFTASVELAAKYGATVGQTLVPAAGPGLFGAEATAATGGISGGTVAGDVAFEFTGAVSNQSNLVGNALFNAGASGLASVLQPNALRPRESEAGPHQTAIVSAARARYVMGETRTGWVLCYLLERNIAEAFVKASEGVRSRNRTFVQLPEEFGRLSANAGGMVATGEGSGSIGLWAGLVCEGEGAQAFRLWFGDEVVPGTFTVARDDDGAMRLAGAFTPTEDGPQRAWATGYRVIRNEQDGILNDRGAYDYDTIAQPELLAAFGDGNLTSNVEGIFGQVMRALSGPREFRSEGTPDGGGNQWSFNPPDHKLTHRLYDSSPSDSAYQRNSLAGDADYELSDSVPRDGRFPLPKWDRTHTLEGVAALAIISMSRHAEGGPGPLSAAETLLRGPGIRWIASVSDTEPRVGVEGVDYYAVRDGRGVTKYEVLTAAPAWTRNGAAYRYWWIREVRGIREMVVNMEVFNEAFDCCDDWLELPAVQVPGPAYLDAPTAQGRAILRTTFGDGYAASTTADERAAAIRAWNQAYAGRGNGSIRYPYDGVFESPGPVNVQAIEGAMDDAWLGRAMEIGGELHFRPGYKRPAVLRLDESDLLAAPQVVVATTGSDRLDGVEVGQTFCREYGYEQRTRRFLRDGVTEVTAGNVTAGPETAFVHGTQHLARLSGAMLKRAEPDLLRLTALIHPGRCLENTAVVAGDVIELSIESYGMGTRRYEVAGVNVDWLAGAAVALELVAEPEDLWDDFHDLLSPYLAENFALQSLGAPLAPVIPVVPSALQAGVAHPRSNNQGYPGQKLYLNGHPWVRRSSPFSNLPCLGDVALLNNPADVPYDEDVYWAVSGAVRIGVVGGYTSVSFFKASRDNVNRPTLPKTLWSDPDNPLRLFQLRIQISPGINNSVSFSLNLVGPGRPDDIKDSIEEDLGILIRRRRDGHFFLVQLQDTTDPLTDPYSWPEAITPGVFNPRDPRTWQDGEIADVAFVRWSSASRFPKWYRRTEPLRAEAGGPYHLVATRAIGEFPTIPTGGFPGGILPPILASVSVTMRGGGLGGAPWPLNPLALDPRTEPYNYSWSVDGPEPQTSTDQSPTFSFLYNGGRTVTLEVTDMDGTVATDTAHLFVEGGAPAPLEVSISGSYEFAERQRARWTRTIIDRLPAGAGEITTAWTMEALNPAHPNGVLSSTDAETVGWTAPPFDGPDRLYQITCTVSSVRPPGQMGSFTATASLVVRVRESDLTVRLATVPVGTTEIAAGEELTLNTSLTGMPPAGTERDGDGNLLPDQEGGVVLSYSAYVQSAGPGSAEQGSWPQGSTANEPPTADGSVIDAQHWDAPDTELNQTIAIRVAATERSRPVADRVTVHTTYTVTVIGTDQPLVAIKPRNMEATRDSLLAVSSFTFIPKAAGGTEGIGYQYSISNEVAGLKVVADSASPSGFALGSTDRITAAAGRYTVTLTVTDRASPAATATVTFTVTVIENLTLTITQKPDTSTLPLTEGGASAVRATTTWTGSGTPVVTWAVSFLGGARGTTSISPTTGLTPTLRAGRIHGAHDTGGRTVVTARVTATASITTRHRGYRESESFDVRISNDKPFAVRITPRPVDGVNPSVNEGDDLTLTAEVIDHGRAPASAAETFSWVARVGHRVTDPQNNMLLGASTPAGAVSGASVEFEAPANPIGSRLYLVQCTATKGVETGGTSVSVDVKEVAAYGVTLAASASTVNSGGQSTLSATYTTPDNGGTPSTAWSTTPASAGSISGTTFTGATFTGTSNRTATITGTTTWKDSSNNTLHTITKTLTIAVRPSAAVTLTFNADVTQPPGGTLAPSGNVRITVSNLNPPTGNFSWEITTSATSRTGGFGDDLTDKATGTATSASGITARYFLASTGITRTDDMEFFVKITLGGTSVTRKTAVVEYGP